MVSVRVVQTSFPTAAGLTVSLAGRSRQAGTVYFSKCAPDNTFAYDRNRVVRHPWRFGWGHTQRIGFCVTSLLCAPPPQQRARRLQTKRAPASRQGIERSRIPNDTRQELLCCPPKTSRWRCRLPCSPSFPREEAKKPRQRHVVPVLHQHRTPAMELPPAGRSFEVLISTGIRTKRVSPIRGPGRARRFYGHASLARAIQPLWPGTIESQLCIRPQAVNT